MEEIRAMKLISPDFYLGRILVGVKSMLDLAWLLLCEPTKRNLWFARLVLKVKPKYTMVKNRNLQTLFNLVDQVNRRQITGDIVECGVWNGGSAAIMAAASMDEPFQKKLRTIWLFDSFEGLPPPGEKDGELERENYFPGWNRGNIRLVKEIFDKIGYPKEKFKIVPGWFDQTLIREPIKDIVILHIDADWYDSVKIVLDTLYNRVVPGGFVVLDDYGLWPGCQQAVMDFFAEHRILGITIRQTGKQGAFFQIPFGVPTHSIL
jgi:O-methyltransferase